MHTNVQILFKNTHAGNHVQCKHSPIYVQTNSNLGRRTMLVIIIVYINNVLVIKCLSPKPSVMDL